jgi:putative transposase
LTFKTIATEDATTRKSLGRLIGAFKTVSTKRINLIRDTSGSVVWQRNYYEHIIRNDKSLHYIRHYIPHNPISWQQDQLHPDNPSQWEGDRAFLTLRPAIARYNS